MVFKNKDSTDQLAEENKSESSSTEAIPEIVT